MTCKSTPRFYAQAEDQFAVTNPPNRPANVPATAIPDTGDELRQDGHPMLTASMTTVKPSKISMVFNMSIFIELGG